MRGKRNDLSYDKIIKFIKRRETVTITQLYKFLDKKMLVTLQPSRSRLVKRLIDLNLIEIVGDKLTRRSRSSIYRVTDTNNNEREISK